MTGLECRIEIAFALSINALLLLLFHHQSITSGALLNRPPSELVYEASRFRATAPSEYLLFSFASPHLTGDRE